MYLHLLVPIALFLALLAACFAGLLWRLASRFDARHCTAEWLDHFSLESYAPMERLLEKSDGEFLASQAGYRPEIARRLMKERRKIFSLYLKRLVKDFNQLIGIGKLLIVYAAEDQQEFARNLWRRQTQFYASIVLIRLQLAVYPFGWRGADIRSLVEALTTMRDQVQQLVSAAPRRIETA